MKYMNKIWGTASLIFYLFTLYQLWHLCQYGGLRSHTLRLALGMIGFAFTFILWALLRGKNQREASVNGIVFSIFILGTLFFGCRIVYSAIPYHGALSWKVDEWKRKKEIELKRNNIFKDGAEGVLTDLDEALDLPEELYIANKYQVTFDDQGTIRRIYAFIYGKDEKGKKKTYLIDYDADSSKRMTVWLDGNVNGEDDENMLLYPMIELLNNADWVNQVKEWREKLGKEQIYELLYLGRRSFYSAEGLKYVSANADGGGAKTGSETLALLEGGGRIVGFEVSLSVPGLEEVTPVGYIMEPEYVSQSEEEEENAKQQAAEAKAAESWITDRNDGSMYFLLDEDNGWRLTVVDAAAGSRFYAMERTVDGGVTWEGLNEAPFGAQAGVAQGLVFFNERLGVAGLSGASKSYSALYITRDGGTSFEKIELPMDRVKELPRQAKEYGFTIEDYDYLNMPQQENGALTIRVTTDAAENEGIVFRSEDEGDTWEYSGIAEEKN